MIRIDSHFHPNFNFLFPKKFLRRHASRIWKQFEEHRLDVVFITEHAYKHPARSFRIMQKTKPKGAGTMLVPAVEALTKEGMDVIVFSKDEYVYTQKDIITPYCLTMDELLRRVCRNQRLFAIIPHPFIPCGTGLMHHRTREETKECIRRARFVEKYNASLRPTCRLLCTLHLRRFLKKTDRSMQQTATVPREMIPPGVLSFGGSDAHHWWNIGTHLVIHAARPAKEKDLFRIILCEKHKRRIVWKESNLPLLLPLIFDSISVFFEGLRKKLRLWKVDQSLLAGPAYLFD